MLSKADIVSVTWVLFLGKNNTFQLAIKHKMAKAREALIKIISETGGHNLYGVYKPHLLDPLIILIYGCEV